VKQEATRLTANGKAKVEELEAELMTKKGK
jgi:hypothetical protein